MKLGGSLGNVPQQRSFFFVERYLPEETLLISLSYCEYVPSSTITNIPFYYLAVDLKGLAMGKVKVQPETLRLNLSSLG
jgi:hypothetical protein